ncbi:uncharacterized protein LOC144108837 [Amblyomma americanum]
MPSLAVFTQALLLGLAWLEGTHAACDVNSPPGLNATPYPDIRRLFLNGYKLIAEASSVTDKNTLQMTEYYDTKQIQGYLRLYNEGIVIETYYNHDTNEAFFYTDSSCNTFPLDKPPEFMQKMVLQWADEKGTYTIYGASSLFVGPLVKKNVKVAFQGTNFTVRGIPALKWSVCLNESEDDGPVDVYFSNPGISSSGSAYNPPTPLRIVQGKEVSDITMMTEYEGDPEEKFLIPVGHTCTRLAQGLRKPPDFANVSLEFHAEIMFRNLQESPDFYYSSHLNFIRDLSSNHLSAIFEPWATSDRNAKKMVFGGTYQEIYDYENGIYFKINKTGHRESCTMNTLDGYKLEMELPGFGKLGMVPVIFVEEKDLMQASYLGIHYERGMPTHAFEIITDGLGGGTSKIKKAALTYYYLGDDMIWDEDLTRKNIPIKISARTFTADKDGLKPYFDITLNIHDLTTVMERMNEEMSVLSCYDENEQSFTWFQVGFPVGGKDLLQAAQAVSAVKEAFLRKLYQVGQLTPPRVPRVLVDFTSNAVFATALILERPLITSDYDKKENFGIKSFDYKEAVIPLQDCLKLCSLSGPKDCTAAAYCGASCYLTKMYSEDDQHNLEQSVDCSVYAKNKYGLSRNLTLTDDVIDKLVTSVSESQFFLVVKSRYGYGTLTLIAETTDDSIASLPQTFGSSDPEMRDRHKRIGSELRGFTTSQFGVHLKAAAPSSLHVGTFPLEDCSDICRDRDDCLAFSSCLTSNECVLSFDRTPPSDAVEKQTMCSVFSKTFTVSFNELEGMSLAMTAKKFAAVPDKEDCARLCLGEKDFDCKSFDYCSLTRDPATVCRLHDTHLREYGDPAKLDAKNAEKCFHYSKKYLYDFSKTKSQRIFDRQAFTVINLVSVEECARQCWEATFECKNFDFCSPPGTRKLGYGDCTLYARSDGPIKTTMSPICSTYTYTGNPDMVQAPSVEQSAALHSNAKAGGLAFFMVLLGIGIGAAALFGYGFYKAHRANRV